MPGNEASPQNGSPEGRFGRRRRRRSRHRGRPGEASQVSQGENLPVIDLAPGELTPVAGVLYIKPNGGGILVQAANNFVPQPGDAIVPRNVIEKMHLDPGLLVSGNARRGGNGGLEFVVLETIEGVTVEEFRDSRRPFSELISIDPNEMFKLEVEPERLTTRVVDLVAPIGRGQRCLIVAPPKSGQDDAAEAHGARRRNESPRRHVIVLLVDERPEEVTDFRRRVRGEVIASLRPHPRRITSRSPRSSRTARGAWSSAGSTSSSSSTRSLACRAPTTTMQRGGGKILSGGIDARTMEKPRRFFGAARNAEDGGSLTIVATALVDTGSRMDEVIFQEFKGTGNTEIVLDRGALRTADLPVHRTSSSPARARRRSCTPPADLPKIDKLRRALAGTDP